MKYKCLFSLIFLPMTSNIISNYQQRANEAQQQADNFKKLVNTYSFLRLGTFLLLGLAVYIGAISSNFTVIMVAFVALLFCFAWLVSRQSVFERELKYYRDLKTINDNEVASITNYSNLYSDGLQFADDKHYYTSDLDIFGRASLFQLINRAATTPGNQKLAGWLKAPAQKDVILSRQEAVKELTAKPDWKLDTQTRLLFAQKQDSAQLQNLATYLRTPLGLTGENWLNTYSRIAPYILLTLAIGAFFVPVLKTVAAMLALVNLGIVGSKGLYIKKADLLAGKIGDTLVKYAAVFSNIEKENWVSKKNTALAQVLISSQTSGKIKELGELINKLNYHLNIIVAVFLNAIFLWDIRQIIAIENWKRSNHENLEAAFDVIADFEALISLSSLHTNYTDWTFPDIADGKGYTVIAKNVSHPLINHANRVANDFELNDAFKVDIITGSNMAGKSTFLRTIGINTVLALSGAPVCADSMTVSIVTLISYMRIKDSLNESTSTFKAELDRLQMLLKAVEHDPKVFFLIDEMLRGTNSVDKYLGSKAVIEQLISKKAVGMVATHDLEIAKLEQDYPDYVRNFYFDIQVRDGEMLFDYKIKHGECKTFNASMLLKRIGINIETK